MKKLLSICMFLAVTAVSAQIQTPQPSPSGKIWQTVGLTEVTIEYSRPAMRGREIFGDLVPYNKKWRTGANENTKITFSDDVKIGGENLPKGTYAIYTVPSKSSWQVMFYKQSNNWGLPQDWDDNEVALTVNAKVEKMPMKMESFTIVIDELKYNQATINFLWENTVAHFDVMFPTENKTMASIENALNGPSGRDYYAAADYYYTTGKDLNQALAWMKKALDGRENPPFWMLRKKSLIEAKMGKKKDAIETAKASLKAAKAAGNDDYVKMNQDSLKEWGAM